MTEKDPNTFGTEFINSVPKVFGSFSVIKLFSKMKLALYYIKVTMLYLWFVLVISDKSCRLQFWLHINTCISLWDCSKL